MKTSRPSMARVPENNYQKMGKGDSQSIPSSLESPMVGGAAAHDSAVKKAAQDAINAELNEMLDVKNSPIKFLEETLSSGVKAS